MLALSNSRSPVICTGSKLHFAALSEVHRDKSASLLTCLLCQKNVLNAMNSRFGSQIAVQLSNGQLKEEPNGKLLHLPDTCED